MKITVIQVNNNILGIQNRLKYIEEQIKNIDETDFVILTELSTSSYIPNQKIWQYAESNGELTKEWATEIARKYNIYIGAGFVEKAENDIYNSYLIANSDGILGTVRKSEPESNIFKRGKFGHIIETPLGKIAISICFDSHKKAFYDSIKRKLRRSGYHLFDSVENALEYGVPQFRERLFLVGFSTKAFGKKVKCNLSSHKSSNLQTVMQAPWPTTSPFKIDSEVNCPIGIPTNLTVESWFVKNNVSSHPNGQDFFGTKAHNKFMTICEGATAGKSFKRLHRWRYAPTSAYGNNEVHLHPYKARRISVAEAMAIQSAPAFFSLPEDIPLSAKFKMVGNAVPVLLAQGVAESIRDTIFKYLEDNQNG